MSKGSEIHKRFGLKFAVAYRVRKVRKKYARILESKPFVQSIQMLHLIFTLKDSKKFEIYLLLRKYHCLIINSKHLEFIALYYQEILQWLESDEFKQTYLDTNHPYPPLLNPKRLHKDSKNPYAMKDSNILESIDTNPAKDTHNKKIESHNPNKNTLSHTPTHHLILSYENIPAELAWEMNVPLPQCDMVKFESHGTGSVFKPFLEKLGIKVTQHLDENYCAKSAYCSFFNDLNQGARILAMRDYLSVIDDNAKKLYALIPSPQIICLNQVRDPISMLRHYMSIRRPGKAPRKFNLTFDKDFILTQLVEYSSAKNHIGSSYYPNLSATEVWLEYRYMCFHDTQLFRELVNINEKEVSFMDMSEIVGEKTLQTMANFAQLFNVPAPQASDKEFFLTRSHDFGCLLPLTLYVHQQDLGKFNTNDADSLTKQGGITIHILKKFHLEDKQDISAEILGNLAHDMVRIAIDKNDEARLKQNTLLYQRTKEYLQDFIPSLIEQDAKEKAKKLTENDVLEHFKKDAQLRAKCKNIFDKHLELIKSHRPDIVASWKYYQEFEKLSIAKLLDKD